MKIILLSSFIIVGLSLSSCTKEEIPQPESRCEESYTSHPNNSLYSGFLDNYVSANQAPGSILGIKKWNEPAWVGSYGQSNIETGTYMTPCTPFRTGSVTKMFTAVVVMKLVEEGKFTLETTITQLLPEMNGNIPQAGSITVRQLLNHTSGLKQPTDDDVRYQTSLINNPDDIGNMDAAERLENYIYDSELKNQPGAGCYYSNAGYWMLQLIIEKITGRSLQQNMEEIIFQPLLMHDTYLEKRDDTNVSRGYNFSGNKMMDVSQWDRADSDGDPAAGIISTAPDLLKFGEALFTNQILSEESLAEMKITTCDFGLGMESWVTEEGNSGYGKNGSSLGVDANLIYFPENEMAIVIFSNFGGGNYKQVIDEILE